MNNFYMGPQYQLFTWPVEHDLMSIYANRTENHILSSLSFSTRRHSVLHSGANSRWCKPLVNHSELSGRLSVCLCVRALFALHCVEWVRRARRGVYPVWAAPQITHAHTYTLTLWHFWVAIRRKKMLCLKAIFTLCFDFCFQFLGMDHWMTVSGHRLSYEVSACQIYCASSILQQCDSRHDKRNRLSSLPSLPSVSHLFPSRRRDKLLWLTMKQLSGPSDRLFGLWIGSNNLGSVVLRLPLLGFYFISLCCFTSPFVLPFCLLIWHSWEIFLCFFLWFGAWNQLENAPNDFPDLLSTSRLMAQLYARARQMQISKGGR